MDYHTCLIRETLEEFLKFAFNFVSELSHYLLVVATIVYVSLFHYGHLKLFPKQDNERNFDSDYMASVFLLALGSKISWSYKPAKEPNPIITR